MSSDAPCLLRGVAFKTIQKRKKYSCLHGCSLRFEELSSAQALALLGKLGGRNRRFLKDPLELDLKDNPEHGLRLILTFQPSTSFLVPLDRCLALSSQSLLSPTSALLFSILVLLLSLLSSVVSFQSLFAGWSSSEGSVCLSEGIPHMT